MPFIDTDQLWMLAINQILTNRLNSTLGRNFFASTMFKTSRHGTMMYILNTKPLDLGKASFRVCGVYMYRYF